MKTILEVLTTGTSFLEKKGVESARLNMEHLLAHALGLRRMDLYLQFDRPLSESELAPLRGLTTRRAAGEPLQHVLGTVEFYRFTFGCDARALIPRPETEELVEKIVARRRGSPPRRVLDMGCGSGVIGLCLAAAFPKAHVVLADVAREALDLARENAVRVAAQLAAAPAVSAYLPLGAAEGNSGTSLHERMDAPPVLSGAPNPAPVVDRDYLNRLTFTLTSLFDDLPAAAAGESGFDLLAANLPYVPVEEISTLSREVHHDPLRALDGGLFGLEVIERFIRELPPFAAPGALIALEHGPDHADSIVALLQNSGFVDVLFEHDMAGRPRFTFATMHRMDRLPEEA